MTQKQHGAGIPALRTDELLSLQIPLPPLAVQKEIVETLDKFDALTEGLQREIELRQKQYEYYRNQLFQLMEKSGYSEKLEKYNQKITF